MGGGWGGVAIDPFVFEREREGRLVGWDLGVDLEVGGGGVYVHG